eukprot:Nk52_evm55s1020 gene=Nk52_evmTU55s1020
MPAARQGAVLLGGYFRIEEELDELKKKYSLLEGDRKAYYENSQQKIKENRELIQQYRENNKGLREALVEFGKADSATVKAEDIESLPLTSKIEKLDKKVFSMRKKMDEVHVNLMKKYKQVTELEDMDNQLTNDDAVIQSNAKESELAKTTRSLENRYDKAQIKYQEALSIKKTYAEIIARLKSEQMTYDSRLADTEKVIAHKRKEVQELLELSKDALYARDSAKEELTAFEKQLAEDRKVREAELTRKKEEVKNALESTEKMEKRQQMKMELEEETPKDNQQDEEEAERKISSYEDALRMIKDATGVADVSEVIDKFLTQGDTHKHLLDLKTENEQRIETLSEEKGKLTKELNELTYSGEVESGTRRIIDEFENKLREAQEKYNSKAESLTRMCKTMMSIKSGVLHLASKVGDAGEVAYNITDDNIHSVLSTCEEKIGKILLKLDEKSTPEKEEEHARTPAVILPEHNVRVVMPTGDKAEVYSDDEDGPHPEDEVPSRENMKKAAAVLVDSKTKKTKRKGRRGRK